MNRAPLILNQMISDLRDLGFKVEEQPKGGFLIFPLVDTPNEIAQALWRGLGIATKTNMLGWDIRLTELGEMGPVYVGPRLIAPGG